MPRGPRGRKRKSNAAAAPALAPSVLGGAGRHDDHRRGPPRLPHAWDYGRPPATGAFGAGRSTDEPVAAQHERAAESGRGRHAQAPWQIPWQGWKDIFWRTYEQIGEDRLLAVAAGVVFYGLFAVFPAVTALVSLYGLFASPSAISDQLSLLAGILPQGAVEILREQIGRLIAGSGAKLGIRLHLRACGCAMERKRGDEGNYGRAERRLRGKGETRLHQAQSRFSCFYARRHRGRAARSWRRRCSSDCAQLSRACIMLTGPAVSTCTLAVLAGYRHFRPRRALPLRTQPPRTALAMDQRGKRFRRYRVARKFRAAVVVPCELRPL